MSAVALLDGAGRPRARAQRGSIVRRGLPPSHAGSRFLVEELHGFSSGASTGHLLLQTSIYNFLGSNRVPVSKLFALFRGSPEQLVLVLIVGAGKRVRPAPLFGESDLMGNYPLKSLFVLPPAIPYVYLQY